MKKMFFFDLDGTLWDADGSRPRLLPTLHNALLLLRSKGHIIVACSARQLCFIEKWLPDLFDCLILLNGAYVKANETIILDEPLCKQELQCIDRQFKPYHGSYIYIGNFHAWAYHISPRHRFLLDEIYMVGSGYTQFGHPCRDEKVYSLDMFFESCTDFERVRPLFEENNWLTLNYHIGDFTGDVSFRNRSKATAALTVLDYYGLKVTDAYAFGDGTNDLPLFQLVRHTCAVKNAKPELKATASFVSSKPSGLGVLQGLHHWGVLD